MINRRTFSKAVGLGSGAAAVSLAGLQGSASAASAGRGPGASSVSAAPVVPTITPGTHTASLRFSRVAASKLRTAGKPVVLTIEMTLTDVYGRKTTRSVKLTLTR